MTQLNYKKIFALGVIAVIFAIIGWVLPITTTTNESVFQIEVNNTNLAPTVPGETNGTGERVQGITYYANDTPIELFLWGHGQNISQTAELHLFINGTKVADTSGRALGAAEQSNKTIVAMIPRYASYLVEVYDIHHYEWREYKVLSGQNGSVIINYINTSSVNQSALDLKVNISGSTWTGNMIMDGISITTNTVGDKDAYIYMESGLPTIRMRARTNGTAGYFELFPSYADILVSGRRYNFTNDSLDIGNASLVNCSNCVNQTSLNEKVSKSGDFLNGSLHNTTSSIEDSINLTNGQVVIRSQNTTSLYASDFVLTPDEIDIEIHDGFTNLLKIISDKTSIEIGGVTEFSVNNSTINLGNNNITNCANCDSYSKLVNRTYNSTGQVSTGTNTIPHDDTIPTSTEGFAVLNITYTPKNANNYLKICSQVMLSTSQSAANLLGNFVLYNNTTIGISNTYSPAQFFEVNTGVCAFIQAGTTSPVLIQSRAGSNAAGTITINGAAGSRNYGGVYNTYLVVDEYVP